MADDDVSKGTIIRELGRLKKKSNSESDGLLHWRKDAELNKLEEEYNRLKRQKQELEEKAKEASILAEIQQYIEHVEEGGEEDVPLGKLADEEVLFKALELTKKKKLLETYNAYRLTGIACVLLSENCQRFCLDTCYKGQYFEPYYMEIQIKDGDIQILKHTIPFFIPLDEIVQKYEGLNGLKEFVPVISAYLNAFIARREQFSQVQEINEHYVISDFYSTPAFDFVKFTLKFSSNDAQNIIVKMKYTNLRDKLPKEVNVNLSDSDDDELFSTLQDNLLCTEVKTAIMTAIS